MPCDMKRLKEIANAYSLYLIEDATEALGARFGGSFVGTIGDLGCLSFNGNKMMTTGLGGMVLGNDEKRLDHIHHLANQAKVNGPEYIHDEIGFNYRMTNIGAAIGLAQLKRLETFLNKKIAFRSIYKEILEDVLTFQEPNNGSSPVWWLTTVKLPVCSKVHTIQEQMMVHGIPTRRIFFPLDRQKYLQKFVRKPCKVAHEIYEQGICLPSSTVNSEDDAHFAANILKKILVGKRMV
ncbi:Bacillosamine/Legionaminic acid biosynthesis aminotransferase PglE [Dissulfuribacter thermophilus]|uniref:Bacillosamine/Legionaminic acid biosynthesis aminotransferase PglE n=1 Tax=Dissulfuribacter thermophilus TaxID=1156395 RepID=A0A1B9F2J7_9BACT|nr:Bacillosamine/Legionaminic acid biosynthesis aminotransferase PglE [Dissulfuribacter thermophilus]